MVVLDTTICSGIHFIITSVYYVKVCVLCHFQKSMLISGQTSVALHMLPYRLDLILQPQSKVIKLIHQLATNALNSWPPTYRTVYSLKLPGYTKNKTTKIYERIRYSISPVNIPARAIFSGN